MTKREQAEMAALREALAVATASLSSDYPDPVVIPVSLDNQYVNGWGVFNTEVKKLWREGHLYGWERHRVGSRYDAKSPDYNCPASQVGKIMYATERDALIALRRAIEKNARAELANLDRKIAALPDLT